MLTALAAFLSKYTANGYKPRFFGVCNVGYNTAGNWSDSARWSCGAVPGAGDSATINGGTVTLDADATVANLTLTGGTLTGANNLTITGALTWSGGTMSGAGATNIASGASGAFTGAHDHMLLNGRTLNNAGSVIWTGARNLYIYTGGALNNSGTFDAQNRRRLPLRALRSFLFQM